MPVTNMEWMQGGPTYLVLPAECDRSLGEVHLHTLSPQVLDLDKAAVADGVAEGDGLHKNCIGLNTNLYTGDDLLPAVNSHQTVSQRNPM